MPTKRTHDEFVNLVADIQPDIEVLGEYINSAKKVLVRHTKCGYEWEGNPSTLLAWQWMSKMWKNIKKDAR